MLEFKNAASNDEMGVAQRAPHELTEFFVNGPIASAFASQQIVVNH
jgi:hypothetical protein